MAGKSNSSLSCTCATIGKFRCSAPGHIAQALVPILLEMNCRVTCLDQRQDWLARIAGPSQADQDLQPESQGPGKRARPAKLLCVDDPGARDRFAGLGGGAANDRAALRWCLGKPSKSQDLAARSQGNGDSRTRRSHSFFCPMGLPIGNNTPPEIAISVLSQLIQERDRLGIIQQKTKTF